MNSLCLGGIEEVAVKRQGRRHMSGGFRLERSRSKCAGQAPSNPEDAIELSAMPSPGPYRW